MVFAHKEFDATDEAGNILTNVQVRVELESGGLVSIYSDRAGSTPLANPATFADGHVNFYAAGGNHKITLTKGAYTRVLHDVAIGLLGEKDSLTVTAISGAIGSSIRNRFEGYTPVYNLDDEMTEGAGTDLAVQNIVDIGDITLPSGAEKQYAWLRARGTFTNGDAFETNGGRLIGYNLYSENSDLYGVIGTVYLLSGDKEVKSIYGRAVNESADGGVVVGLVGAVTLATGAVTDHAWAMQLTHDGPALATAGNNRIISVGTNEATKTANYGIYFDEPLGFDIAVIRAWQTNAAGTGDFLQWLDSGDNVLFKVGNNGDVYMGATSAAQRSFRFFNTTREFAIQAVNTGDRVRMQAGAVGDLWSFTAATLATLGDTSMSIRARNTAGSALLAVTLGAVDSGGAGFRLMRVPN